MGTYCGIVFKKVCFL